MFENKYTVDVKRYVKWYAPPVAQRKGFRLWAVLFVLSAAATLLGYIFNAGDKALSICWLMLFISCYRGLFFDTMYAQRQFYSLCRSINKGVEQQWTRHNLATAEGIESYTDDELCLFLRWEEVDAVREDANHLDIYAAEQLVRFEKDSFVTGTAEELVQWLGEKLPHIAIERGKPLYLC